MMPTIVRPQSRQEWRADPTILSNNDRALVFRPRLATPRSPGVIVAHGALSSATAGQDPAMNEFMGRLAAIGCTVVHPDIAAPGTNHLVSWGTPAVTARIDEWRQWLVSQGADADRIVVMGLSMGAYNALRYAVDYRDHVAAVVGFVPFIDLAEVRGDRTNPDYPTWGGLVGTIDSAWGITPTDPLPAGADLYSLPEPNPLVDLPCLLFFRSDDNVAASWWSHNLAGIIRGVALPAGTGGHAFDVARSADFDAIASLIFHGMNGMTGTPGYSRYAQAVLTDRPIGYWRFNERARPYADRAGAIDLTGGSGAVPPRVDGAIADDIDGALGQFTTGAAPFASRTDPGLATPTGPNDPGVSIEFWLRYDTTPTGEVFFLYRMTATAPSEWIFFAGVAGCRPMSGGAFRMPGIPVSHFTTGEWVHCVFVYSRATGGRCYANSQPAAGTATYSVALGSGDNTSISLGWDIPRVLGLDEVALYRYALNADEIAAHYAAGRNLPAPVPQPSKYATAVRADQPVGYWRLNERSPEPYRDEIAGAHMAITGSGTQPRPVRGALPNERDRGIGLTTPAATIAQAAADPRFVLTTFSIELWVREVASPADAASSSDIFVRSTGTSAANWSLYHLGVSALALGSFSTGGGWRVLAVTPDGALADGLWHHFVATYGPAGAAWWRDGVQVTTAAYQGEPNTTSDQGPRIGSGSYGAREIDELAIYNRVLTQTQIAAHYAASR